MDDTALTYMEAINKIRDCFEVHLKSEQNREFLTKFVDQYLTKEGVNSDGEIIYIMFLYLSRLDGGQLSAKNLIHSIVL